MKTKILLILISSLLLFSCSNNTEMKTNNDTENFSDINSVNQETKEKATISPDNTNEATEVPEELDTGSGETATTTEFVASSGTTLTQSGN